LALALLVIGCAPALCEELLFRGLTLHALEGLGTRRAILCSGLLFALMHGQISALPVHLALGALLGAVLVGYGSLWAPMVFHAAFNGFTLLIAYLFRGAAETAQSVAPAPGLVEALGAMLPVLAICGGLAAALIWFPMRAAMRKSPPALFAPSGAGLSRPARLLMIFLLALFALQYVGNILFAIRVAA
jgi:membrane protease YdiL (CAAX protease family)